MNYRALANEDINFSEDEIETSILHEEDEEMDRLAFAFRNMDLSL